MKFIEGSGVIATGAGQILTCLKRFLRSYVLPPSLYQALQKRKWAWRNELPLDEYMGDRWSLLRASLDGAERYLEYGCGLSSEFVASNYDCQIRSVETSSEWAEKIQANLGQRADIFHVNLGPVGPWGRPEGYSHRQRFTDYCEAGFKDDYAPDVVLIDGRFRVAVFLTALLRVSPGTHMVFDDYPNRPHYHVVEEIILPVELSEQQAKFVRPTQIDAETVLRLRDGFIHVME